MVSVSNLNRIEPLSNEPELENSLHLAQIILLLTCLEWWWQERQDFFAAGNLSIYYKPEQLKSNTFRGPGFFVVLNTQRRPRSSWMVSMEDGKFPNLIVEILSPATAKADRNSKKELYQNVFKVPEYFWFDPRPKKLEFKGFRLQSGEYQPIAPNEQGWLWSEQLDLYLGVADEKLRYFTRDGVMIPNFEESTAQQGQAIAAIQRRLAQEQSRTARERQRAEQSEELVQQQGRENERLWEFLRSQGIDPDQLS